MSGVRTLRFYCDESGQTGTNWLDDAQPIVVHGGWLFPEGSEQLVAEGVSDIRQRYHLNAPELKWGQFGRNGRLTAFRELFALCLSNGALPILMVMDKRYAIAAKIIETYFDPLYNPHFSAGFTGDFETKKRLAESVHLSPNLVSRFGPLLRRGERPTAEEVTMFAGDLGRHLTSSGLSRFGKTLMDPSVLAIDDIRDEFNAEPMVRTTTWTLMWAMASIVIDFADERGFEVEVLQDQMVRFDDLIEQIDSQPGIARVELVDSKDHLGVQLADLLCGFVRTVFAKITLTNGLDADENHTCADLFMLKQEFETWNGNLPEATWLTFIELSVKGLKRHYGGTGQSVE